MTEDLEGRYRWVHDELDIDGGKTQASVIPGQAPGSDMSTLLRAGWEPVTAAPSPTRERHMVVLMRRPDKLKGVS